MQSHTFTKLMKYSYCWSP